MTKWAKYVARGPARRSGSVRRRRPRRGVLLPWDKYELVYAWLRTQVSDAEIAELARQPRVGKPLKEILETIGPIMKYTVLCRYLRIDSNRHSLILSGDTLMPLAAATRSGTRTRRSIRDNGRGIRWNTRRIG